MTSAATSRSALQLTELGANETQRMLESFRALHAGRQPRSLAGDPRWLDVLAAALRHRPFCFEVRRDSQVLGLLSLVLVQSRLFGRFLVSLPYINSAGVVAAEPLAADALIERAVDLADQLDVRYLELRHEAALPHSEFNFQLTSKVHMRLPLPESAEALWDSFKPKVRNQIRKGESHRFSVSWGGQELLEGFYDVFSRRMRDLGTPVYPQRLFAEILSRFAGQAELCVVRLDRRPAAAALLMHGPGVTEVPSASANTELNPTNVNMFMYWQLLCRAAERRQQAFDFGRSSTGSSTYRFKKQWGAAPQPAVWQYYVRRGNVASMRPDDPGKRRLIRIWQKLPVGVTRILGPPIVRGIP